MWTAIQTVIAWVIVTSAAVCLGSLLWLVAMALLDWAYRRFWIALFARPGSPAGAG
jgi:hypothetical protein